MVTAIDDLNLSRLIVIHAGEHSFSLSTKVEAIAARRLREDL
jgi:hypothetical protein